MRLIDADRIIYSWYIDADGEEHDGVTLQSIINKMPTVDAVEVVRCKDCKHRDPEDMKCDSGIWHFPFTTHNDDFCPYGERREDD